MQRQRMVKDVKDARHKLPLNRILLNGPSTALLYGDLAMINYISLALGHGLLAIALLRLVMRPDLDVDPRIQDMADKADAERQAGTIAGRNARRRENECKSKGEEA